MKATECNLKTLQYPTKSQGVSAKPPDAYAERLKQYVMNLIDHVDKIDE